MANELYDEAAHEYGEARRRIAALLERTASADAAPVRIAACPAWDVADLCAHLAGVCSDLAAGRLPDGDTQAWVDGQVAARRGRTVASLLDEWHETSPAFEAVMRERGGLAGLVLDAVAHEHDLRQALGQPGARDARGVAVAMAFERNLLHRDLNSRGLPAVRAVSADGEWLAGDGEPALTLDLSDRAHGTWELFRVLGSRRSVRQVDQYPWQGDWRALSDGVFHMQLPADDLVE
jgi:uncharacterized protein (TIGR03083 family)